MNAAETDERLAAMGFFPVGNGHRYRHHDLPFVRLTASEVDQVMTFVATKNDKPDRGLVEVAALGVIVGAILTLLLMIMIEASKLRAL